MRFERIRLENFKCYADADLRLDDGVTVIHGVNGSGKSSLLEACFFALYGHRALQQNLDDVVSNDAEDASIELWFRHGGADFHLRREIKVRASGAQTTACVLDGPSGTVEGARDVRARVIELLRMDADAFVNCAYVRQGEVNKLINASPGERQDMIDDLLQLGKLEDYRERASMARRAVGRVRGNKEELLEDRESTIAEIEDRDLHSRLNALGTELNETEADIERFEGNRQEAQTTLDDAETVLAEYEERRTELTSLQEAVGELTEAIATAESQREAKAEAIRKRRETAATLRERIADALPETDLDATGADDLTDDALETRVAERRVEREEVREAIQVQSVEAQKHSGAAETARERADELDAEATEKRERADELEAEVGEARAAIEDREERVVALEADLEERLAAFEDAPVEVGEASAHREAVAEELAAARTRVTELEADVKNRRESIAEAEALLEAGKCPECGQPVEDSPHVETIDEDREALAAVEADLADAREERDDRVADLEAAKGLEATEAEVSELRSKVELGEQSIANRREAIDEKEARIEELREAAAEAATEADAKREEAATAAERADAAREAIGERNAESATLAEAIERLETLLGLLADLSDAEGEVERLRTERDNLEETNDLRREQLAEKRERVSDLEESIDEGTIEGARERKARAEDYLEKVDAKLEELGEKRDGLQAKVGGVENELERLEELRGERDAVRDTVERLDSLYEEASRLQEMYADLRSELRQRNVRKLESLLNETFELVYQNASYARIELDGEYELTVYQKDGTPLDPEQLSGGERALFNLSLRCAIYRLLSEGIEGAAPMPPLILDEPTVFLDSGHVSKLVELVEAMRSHGVEQIVVVSHDEELVGAADDLVTVEKDSTTNRSAVTHDRAAALADD
jgi:exonuclease SbcC